MNQNSKMSNTCKVQIYLPDGKKAPIINATKDNSIREILFNTDFQSETEFVVFTSTPSEPHMTPIISLDFTLEKLNMWFDDKTYIAEISLYNKSDTDKYNKDRYNQYMIMDPQ